MRPVDRGAWPEGAGALPLPLAEYSDARPHLLERLGCFCSYCEMPILNQPAVEHVQPKVHHPGVERLWCNLLLSCAYCNATKGSEDVRRDDGLWPDADNTARAFSYSQAGVQVCADLTPALAERAVRLWRLVGLDKRPGADREPSQADPRFRSRWEVWGEACMARDDFAENRSPGVIRSIVRLARRSGFWSVWMAVFEDDREMRAHFIRAFEGTAAGCFDADTRPIQRAGGAL